MGWRDRDWAKLGDAELEELYGVKRRSGSSMRTVVWSAVTVAVLAMAAFTYAQRPNRAVGATGVSPYPAGVLYGVRGTNVRSADGPAGTNTACTDAGFDPRAAAWSCLSWALNLGHLEVIAPRRYDGACTHVRVDQSTGSWMCLSAVPLEPSVLPDSPAARLSF